MVSRFHGGGEWTILPPPLGRSPASGPAQARSAGLSISELTARRLSALALAAFDGGDRMLLENSLKALVSLARPRLPP